MHILLCLFILHQYWGLETHSDRGSRCTTVALQALQKHLNGNWSRLPYFNVTHIQK